MDSDTLSIVLVAALTLAAQPWSILAGIILVTSRGGIVKEIAYVIGWMLALTTVLALTLARRPEPSATQGASSWVAWASIVVGVLLACWLLVRWRAPARPGRAQSPAWLSRVDSMPWPLAGILGAFLPNYLVVVPAGAALAAAGLQGAQLALAAAAFVLVASIGVGAPLAVLLVRGDRAPQTYQSWHRWILANSRAVSYLTGILIGLLIAAQGVTALAA